MAAPQDVLVVFKVQRWQAKAYAAAAVACGISTHSWVVAMLDCAAGLAPLPEGVVPVTLGRRPRRPPPRATDNLQSLSCRVKRRQKLGWTKAAGRALMARQAWGLAVLNAAVGVSELGAQLAALRVASD